MSQMQQILNYVKNINEWLNFLVANAKKAEELPIMEIMDPDGLLIVSELVSGVWVSKRLQVQKIIDGLSMADQDNKVREVLLGTITEDHDLDYLLDNNGITVAANEIIVVTVLDTIDATLVQKQYLWKLGKGEYNPIGSDDISTKLIELQPRFLNDITAEELTSSPSAIVYDFGVISGTILDVLNTADPARDYTDDEKIYYIRATKDGVNLLYNFVGTNGIYGDGESQMVESDLVLVYSSANTDITVLLNNKLDKGTYTGDAGGLNDRITVLEDFNPPPQSGFTGLPVAVWSGVGLTYNYVFPKYYLEGEEYPAISGSITLTAADPTHPRFSTIIADASGVNEVLGVAQENPPTPSLDPNTQLFVINVLINAGETTPADVSQSIIYDEGTEWTTYANHGNITFNNTTGPLNGTYCINVANSVNGTYLELTAPVNQNIIDANGLGLWIKLVNAIAPNRGFTIALYQGTNQVSDDISFKRFNNVGTAYGLEYSNTTDWQLVVIPYQDFNFSNPIFNKLRITFISTVSLKMDYLRLISSSSIGATPDKKGFSKIITDDGIASATSSEDSVSIIGAGGASVSAIGKEVTIDITDGVQEAKDYADSIASEENYTTADKTKVSYITITQAVNLDDIEIRVNDLDAAVVLKGTWDQTTGVFPGSGIAQAGWSYLVTGATETTIDGVKFNNGDRIIAVVDNASTSTYASNWYLADYTDKVNTVAGRTGNVVITSSDLSDFNSAVNALIATAISGKEDTSNKTGTVIGNEASTSLYLHILGAVTYFQQKLTDSIFGAFINSLTAKTTPVDADEFGYVDSEDSNKFKKLSWANIKTTLSTLFTVKDRLLENATVTGSYALDYSSYELWNLTLTGTTTFTESNLERKTILIRVTGNYAITYPSGWSTDITGTYDGTKQNIIVVQYFKSGVYKVQITQPS